jgi:hypothetical protein
LEASGWQPLGGANLFTAGKWVSSDQQPTPDEIIPATGGGLEWTVQFNDSTAAVLSYADTPNPIPAVAATAVTGGRDGPFTAVGLSGSNLGVSVVGNLATVPGAPATGVVVDDTFATLEATGNLTLVQYQVWLREGAPAGPITAALRREGVTIIGTQTKGGTVESYTRQGPGLARTLFLGEAAVVALLAAGGTILGLYLTARRRLYELAALRASGLSRRSLLRAVAGEQLTVLLFGVVVGVGTGLVSAVVALRDVPEFLTNPAAPALATFPSGPTLLVTIVIAVVAVAAVTLAASVSLVRRIRLDQLREAPI